MAEDTRRTWAHDGSVQAYDPHKYSANALQLATDAEVEQWALDLLDLRALPEPGPTGMELTAADELPWDEPTMDVITGLGIADAVNLRLTTRPPAREWRAVAARIQHRIRPGEWVTSIDLRDPGTAGPGGYDSATTRYDVSTYEGAVA